MINLARWCCYQKGVRFSALTHNVGGGHRGKVCLISSKLEQHRLLILCRRLTPVYYEVVAPPSCQEAVWHGCQLIYTVRSLVCIYCIISIGII
jgi:hypothetical protein